MKGSVVKVSQSHREGRVKEYSSSLYDGEFFGYIESFGDGGVYCYEVKAIEKCILMRTPYNDYVNLQSELHNADLAMKL